MRPWIKKLATLTGNWIDRLVIAAVALCFIGLFSAAVIKHGLSWSLAGAIVVTFVGGPLMTIWALKGR